MRIPLKQVKKFHQLLEQFRPPTGLGKWSQILAGFRLAGRPRSVCVSEKIVILSDLLADPEVPQEIKPLFDLVRKRLFTSTAYAERAWLDEAKLEKYLAEFRAHGYQSPAYGPWEEDVSKPRHPIS